MFSKFPYIYNFLCFYASNFCMLHILAMTAIPNIKTQARGRRMRKVPIVENLYIPSTEMDPYKWDPIKSFHYSQVGVIIYNLQETKTQIIQITCLGSPFKTKLVSVQRQCSNRHGVQKLLRAKLGKNMCLLELIAMNKILVPMYTFLYVWQMCTGYIFDPLTPRPKSNFTLLELNSEV